MVCGGLLSGTFDGVTIGNTLGFDTRAVAVLAVIPENVMALFVSAFADIGDGGGATYARVDIEPTHDGYFESADGAFWEYAETVVRARAFGAVNNLADDNAPAIQSAIDFALLNGNEVVIEGLQLVESGFNIGLPVMTGVDPWRLFMERTTGQGGTYYPTAIDPFFGNVTSQANLLTNREDYFPVSITLAPGCIIAVDFTPVDLTPIFANNMQIFDGGAFFEASGAVICPLAQVVDGKYVGPSEDPQPENNIIGLASVLSGWTSINGVRFGYLNCGILGYGNYTCSVTNNVYDNCFYGKNMGTNNSAMHSDDGFWYCFNAVVFDGSNTEIGVQTFEQCAKEVVILAAVSSRFGPFYIEDLEYGGPAGDYAIVLGNGDALQVLTCTIVDTTIGNTRIGKESINIQGADLLTFDNVRAGVGVVDCDGGSTGALYNTDFPVSATLPNGRWSRTNGHIQTAGVLNYPLGDRAILARISIDLPSHDYGTVLANDVAINSFVINDLAPYGYVVAHVSITSQVGGNAFFNTTARLLDSTHVYVVQQNIAASAQDQEVQQSVLITLVA